MCAAFPRSLVGRYPHDYYDLAAPADGIGILPAYPRREPRLVPALLAHRLSDRCRSLSDPLAWRARFGTRYQVCEGRWYSRYTAELIDVYRVEGRFRNVAPDSYPHP
jgi:hypothetical protein